MAASETITTTAAEVLTARVQATATKADIAASSYVESDEQSVQRLAALAPGFVAV